MHVSQEVVEENAYHTYRSLVQRRAHQLSQLFSITSKSSQPQTFPSTRLTWVHPFNEDPLITVVRTFKDTFGFPPQQLSTPAMSEHRRREAGPNEIPNCRHNRSTCIRNNISRSFQKILIGDYILSDLEAAFTFLIHRMGRLWNLFRPGVPLYPLGIFIESRVPLKIKVKKFHNSEKQMIFTLLLI